MGNKKLSYAGILTVIIYFLSVVSFLICNFVFHNGVLAVITLVGIISLRAFFSIFSTELRKGVVFFAIVEGIAFCVLARTLPVLFA